MPSLSLMVQGTTSDAGKTTLVAALCRILKRRAVNVAPFKPQNMALNSAVTVDGGELALAALQALAAGLEPHPISTRWRSVKVMEAPSALSELILSSPSTTPNQYVTGLPTRHT